MIWLIHVIGHSSIPTALDMIPLEELGSCIKMLLSARMVMFMIPLMDKLRYWEHSNEFIGYPDIHGYPPIPDLYRMDLLKTTTLFQRGSKNSASSTRPRRIFSISSQKSTLLTGPLLTNNTWVSAWSKTSLLQRTQQLGIANSFTNR